MTANMTKTQRQLLALAILALVFGILFAVTILPLMSLHALNTGEIDQLEHQLQILERKVGTGEELRAKHIQLKHFLAINRQYLTSKTEALAAANLQEIVKRVSRTNRAEILSTQILPTVKELGFTGVVIKVRMRSNLASLVKVFHTLETGKPFLFINNVSIRSRALQSPRIKFNRGRTSRVVQLDDTLDVEFDLTGYMLRKS